MRDVILFSPKEEPNLHVLRAMIVIVVVVREKEGPSVTAEPVENPFWSRTSENKESTINEQ